MTRSRTLLVLSLLTLALATLLWMLSPPHPEQAQLGYLTSAFALQMVRDWPSLTIVLATPARPGFRLHTLVDFLFIGAYGALWIGMTLRYAKRPWLRWMIVTTFGLAIACDVLENLAILRVLGMESGFTDELALAIRTWALRKWLILMVGWLGLAVALLTHRLGTLAIGYLAGAAIVLAAWFTGPALLQFTAPAIGVALVVQTVYFSRHTGTEPA